MKTAIILAGLLPVAFGVSAAEIPRHPVEALCARYADVFSGSAVVPERKQALARQCIHTNQDAYDAIKAEWGDLTESDQEQCLKVTSHTTDYRSLKYCVDGFAARRNSERRAGSANSFKY